MREVMRAYGLLEGKVAKCPSCGHTEDNSFPPDGGFKCFRNTCGAPFLSNLGVAARVLLGTDDLKGAGETAKSNRRAAYNSLRSKFSSLPELRSSKENRAAVARQKLASIGMGVEDINDEREVVVEPREGDASSPATTEPPAGDTIRKKPADGVGSTTAKPEGKAAKPRRTAATPKSNTKKVPDLPRIRECLAAIIDLPIDEQEVEIDKILSVYKTTKKTLTVKLRELERELRRSQAKESGKPQIRITTDLARTHDAAISALAKDAQLYRRGSDPRERLARVLNGKIDLLPVECLPSGSPR